MSDIIHVVCGQCDTTNRVVLDKLGGNPVCGKCKSPLDLDTPLHLGAGRFEKHIAKSGLPVLVDFWAPWCGPCKMMAPAFSQAAAMLSPHVRSAKVDTQAEEALGARYGIRSIPTMVLFKGGREAARVSGAMNADAIVQWVRSHL